jgi:hypothetical protein
MLCFGALEEFKDDAANEAAKARGLSAQAVSEMAGTAIGDDPEAEAAGAKDSEAAGRRQGPWARGPPCLIPTPFPTSTPSENMHPEGVPSLPRFGPPLGHALLRKGSEC